MLVCSILFKSLITQRQHITTVNNEAAAQFNLTSIFLASVQNEDREDAHGVAETRFYK